MQAPEKGPGSRPKRMAPKGQIIFVSEAPRGLNPNRPEDASYWASKGLALFPAVAVSPLVNLCREVRGSGKMHRAFRFDPHFEPARIKSPARFVEVDP